MIWGQNFWGEIIGDPSLFWGSKFLGGPNFLESKFLGVKLFEGSTFLGRMIILKIFVCLHNLLLAPTYGQRQLGKNLKRNKYY